MLRSTVASKQDPPSLISLTVHELRTPANVVWGYLRMLQSLAEPPLPDRQRHMVDEAEKSFTRLLAIIEELNEVGKLDSGRLTMPRSSVDLFAIATEAAAGTHEAAERDVRLELRGPNRGAKLEGDATRLKTALAAIFRSVLREKAGPCTVVIELSIKEVGGLSHAYIFVAEPDRLESVRSDKLPEFNDTRGGMGLALPHARRVIEGHGGWLWSPPGGAVVAVPLDG